MEHHSFFRSVYGVYKVRTSRVFFLGEVSPGEEGSSADGSLGEKLSLGEGVGLRQDLWCI